jgi:hypothetical protein
MYFDGSPQTGDVRAQKKFQLYRGTLADGKDRQRH